jgi:putative Holliday junction resolvase
MPSLLGLDLGQKRVGVAISDEATTIASALTMVEFKNRAFLAAELSKLVKEYSVTQIVVGLPLNALGEKGPAADKVTENVEWLKAQIPVKWKFWDERYTTKEAEAILLEADVSRARRKEVVDQLAAQRILQSYIDFHKNKAS